MNKARVSKANKLKQKEAVKKFKLKKKKAKPKKKKFITYTVAIRKNRTSPWRVISESVTASNKILATHIAAHRNPNRWVKVFI